MDSLYFHLYFNNIVMPFMQMNKYFVGFIKQQK